MLEIGPRRDQSREPIAIRVHRAARSNDVWPADSGSVPFSPAFVTACVGRHIGHFVLTANRFRTLLRGIGTNDEAVRMSASARPRMRSPSFLAIVGLMCGLAGLAQKPLGSRQPIRMGRFGIGIAPQSPACVIGGHQFDGRARRGSCESVHSSASLIIQGPANGTRPNWRSPTPNKTNHHGTVIVVAVLLGRLEFAGENDHEMFFHFWSRKPQADERTSVWQQRRN